MSGEVEFVSSRFAPVFQSRLNPAVSFVSQTVSGRGPAGEDGEDGTGGGGGAVNTVDGRVGDVTLSDLYMPAARPTAIVFGAPYDAVAGDVVMSFGQPITLPDASQCEGMEISVSSVSLAPNTGNVVISAQPGQTVSLMFPSFELHENNAGYPNWIRWRATDASGLGGGWTWVPLEYSGPQFISSELSAITALIADSWAEPLSQSRLLSQSFHKTWPVDERCFRFDGVGGGLSTSYKCAAGWGNIPNGIDIRLDCIVRPPTGDQMLGGSSKYMELITVQDPAMGGGDRMELAFLLASADNYIWISEQTGSKIRVGDVVLFWEHVPIGAVTESTYHADGGVQYHQRIIIRVVLDTAAGEVRFYRGVTHDGDDITTQGIHRDWRLVGTVSNEDAESIVDMAGWEVDLGLRFKGDIFWMEAYHGPDGTLLDRVQATDADPGDTTFTSTNGKTWTRANNAADVVLPSEYAPSSHNHDGTYAPAAHNHDGAYAPSSHNHDGAYIAPGSPLLLPSPAGQVNGRIAKISGEAWVIGDDNNTGGIVYAKALPASDVSYSNLGAFSTAQATHQLSVVNRRAWVPIFVIADTYTRIGVHVSSSATGSTWRLGLHADDGGWPAAALIGDYGNIDLGGLSGTRRDITISQALATGWYWAQIQVNAYGASTPVVAAVAGSSAHPVVPLGFPTDRINSTRGRAAFYDTGGTGGALTAPPASLAAAGVVLANDGVRVWIWKA